ncbi:MAG: response regulator, partial [Bacteroidaceae bacterium]|nr:response regulator [Bacteroidaceae bacterium]
VMQTEKLSAKGMKYMGLMEKNADLMLTLVNQILDFRKIQNGKMRLHVCEFDLNDFVGSFENEFGVIGEEGNIMFDFKLSDSPIKVWADKERMQIVVRNILTNAFKYTPPGGEVHVSTHLSDDAKKCYIEFQDTGDGIPEDKLEEIFERFTQADNARLNSNPGTGIGLALVHEIIGLHNGKVYASNVEPHGALFTVELQMGKEHYDANEVDFYIDEQMPMQSNAETLKVQEQYDESEPEMNEQLSSLLLVEDNKDLSDMLQMQLSGKYNVYRAVNGVEGLKKVRQYSPDLIVTDQMMPEMTGMEMLQEIRKDFQISHIPVIMLTAKNDDATRTKAITLGANAFITKPFSKEHLEAQIAQLLAERRAFRERLIRELQKKSAENVEVVNDIQKSEAEPKDEKLLVKDVEGRLQFVNEYENTLSAPDRALLEKIKKVIEENMADPDFNIELIAVQLAVSRSVFFKKLKAITGLAPVELVRQIRLAKSCELIKTTTSSFTEIAQIVGFNDLGYFGKCFKKRYGMTLKEYAAKYREF